MDIKFGLAVLVLLNIDLISEINCVHPGADWVHSAALVGGIGDRGGDLQDQVDLCVGMDRIDWGHWVRVDPNLGPYDWIGESP